MIGDEVGTNGGADGPISAGDLYRSALRPAGNGDIFIATEAEKEKIWVHCVSEANRLNELLDTDEVLKAKLGAGQPFTCSIENPGLRPYVSHILHQPGGGTNACT